MKCNKAKKWCRDIGCYHASPHRRTEYCIKRTCSHVSSDDSLVKCVSQRRDKDKNPWKIGEPVIIADHSDAHGDKGKIFLIKHGIILVELDDGCVWPVMPDEIRRDEG